MAVKSIPYSELELSKIVNAVVEDGVVIVTNVLSPEEVEECRQGLHNDLKEHFGVVADKTKKIHKILHLKILPICWRSFRHILLAVYHFTFQSGG